MPTLNIRTDGCYFVRHFYQGFATWQILGEGVRVLENRGIKAEQYFSTDLFMDLWTLGLVYHGDAIPTRRRESRDSTAVAGLRQRVSEFYRFIYARDISAAWKLTRDCVHEFFVYQVTQFGALSSWKIDDVQVYELAVEAQSKWGASHIGVTYVRLSQNSGTPTFLTQYWFRCDGLWLVLWAGFGAAD